jgi:myo-inositol-1(or 4)-monophosphatase
MIVERLSKLLPEAGFIAEEGSTRNEQARYVWVIDPLDGTTNFIHGVPAFSISIALLDKHVPVVGIVHEVNLNECFYATKGSGAFCNGEPIGVSSINNLSEALLATGFPYHNFTKMDCYIAILKEFMAECHGVRRLGSAALDLAYVAMGRFEGFFEYGLKPWDVAAGILIVNEAGGKVTDFSAGDNALFGSEIIAANSIHSHMQKTISKHWSIH